MPNRTSAWALLVALLLGLCRPLCACHGQAEPAAGCHGAPARPTEKDCCAGEDEAGRPAPELPGEDCCCAHSSEPRQKSQEGLGADRDASVRLAWMPAELVDGARPRGHRIALFRSERLPTPPLLALLCQLLI